MKKGFTLLETLIAASLFTMVLTGSLIVFSTVNRNNELTQSARTVAFAGRELTQTIVELTRYSSPKRDSNGQLTTHTGTAAVAGAKEKGIYLDNSPSETVLALNVPDGNDDTVYVFTFTPTAVTPDLNKYQVEVDVIKTTGTQTVTALPTEVVLLHPQGENILTLTTETVSPAVIGGGLDLNLAAAAEVPAFKLEIDWSFASATADFSSDLLQQFSFQTTVTPQSYISRFL